MDPYFLLTVDVDPPFSTRQNYIIENGVTSLLNILDKHAIKATFFVPAVVAKRFPKIVDEITSRKHEVGCHGFKHDPLETTLNVNKQIRIIRAATEIIESVTGIKPIGYRAPLFKWSKACCIALHKNGYVFDSSYVCSPLYGNPKIFFPATPFRLPISANNYLLEIPVSINPLLFFPLGGGWLRIFGLKWAKIGVKMNFILKKPVVFYIHPKDILFKTPNLNWYYYRNVTCCINMLNEIIQYAKNNKMKFLKLSKLAELFYDKF